MKSKICTLQSKINHSVNEIESKINILQSTEISCNILVSYVEMQIGCNINAKGLKSMDA
jgi:hypothetical protein